MLAAITHHPESISLNRPLRRCGGVTIIPRKRMGMLDMRRRGDARHECVVRHARSAEDEGHAGLPCS